jgi:hypothetical protein
MTKSQYMQRTLTHSSASSHSVVPASCGLARLCKKHSQLLERDARKPLVKAKDFRLVAVLSHSQQPVDARKDFHWFG